MQTMSPKEKLIHRDDPELSPLSKDSIGCTIAEHHLEDEEYMQKVRIFPLDPTVLPTKSKTPLPQEIVATKLMDQRHPLPTELLKLEFTEPKTSTQVVETPQSESASIENSSNSINTLGEIEKNSEEEKEEVFFEHIVQKTDTLVGLSLKYHVPTADLVRVNQLKSYQIYYLKIMLIPTQGRSFPPQLIAPPTNKSKIISFQKRVGCTIEEARYYMEECECDEEKALQAYEEEKRWEKQASNTFKGSSLHLDPNSAVTKKSKKKDRKKKSLKNVVKSLLT